MRQTFAGLKLVHVVLLRLEPSLAGLAAVCAIGPVRLRGGLVEEAGVGDVGVLDVLGVQRLLGLLLLLVPVVYWPGAVFR
jgi:hypothetical protein